MSTTSTRTGGIVTRYEVHCAGCPAIAPSGPTADHARAEARRLGWAVPPEHYDGPFCADCRPTPATRLF